MPPVPCSLQYCNQEHHHCKVTYADIKEELILFVKRSLIAVMLSDYGVVQEEVNTLESGALYLETLEQEEGEFACCSSWFITHHSSQFIMLVKRKCKIIARKHQHKIRDMQESIYWRSRGHRPFSFFPLKSHFLHCIHHDVRVLRPVASSAMHITCVQQSIYLTSVK